MRSISFSNSLTASATLERVFSLGLEPDDDDDRDARRRDDAKPSALNDTAPVLISESVPVAIPLPVLGPVLASVSVPVVSLSNPREQLSTEDAFDRLRRELPKVIRARGEVVPVAC